MTLGYPSTSSELMQNLIYSDRYHVVQYIKDQHEHATTSTSNSADLETGTSPVRLHLRTLVQQSKLVDFGHSIILPQYSLVSWVWINHDIFNIRLIPP